MATEYTTAALIAGYPAIVGIAARLLWVVWKEYLTCQSKLYDAGVESAKASTTNAAANVQTAEALTAVGEAADATWWLVQEMYRAQNPGRPLAPDYRSGSEGPAPRRPGR